MDQAATLKAELGRAVSPALAPLLDELLRLISASGAAGDPAQAIWPQLADRPDLTALFQQVNTRLLDFGAAQVGDVTIGDVAGNNVIKVSELIVQLHREHAVKAFSRSPLPAIPAHYITRPSYERALAEALTHPDRRLTLLAGLSGAGKTALAITVVRHVVAHAAFPGGVFWGDLGVATAGEQVWSFLLEVDRQAAEGPHSTWQDQHRTIFWRTVKDTSALIVLDNVADMGQLKAILPAKAEEIGTCRVLIISPTAFTIDLFLPEAQQRVQVGEFTPAEAQALFQEVLGQAYGDLYRADLQAVAQDLEYFPHLVAAAALEFKQGVVSPPAYRQRLKERRLTDGQGIIEEGLMHALAALDSDTQALFPYIGAFGAGSWSPALLAAVAIQPMPQVQQALATLSRRGLIEHTPQHRCRVNGFVRAVAASRLAERGAYASAVAHTLVARHMLDRVQDLIAALRPTPGISQQRDVAFVQTFQRRMLPEAAHLRHSLDWAVATSQWELVRRFSEVNAFELAWDLMSNGVGFQLTFQFATLTAPLIQARSAERYMRTRALLTGSDLVIDEGRMERLNRSGPLIEAGGFDLAIDTPASADPPQRPLPASASAPRRFEVMLQISAGQLLHGVIADVTLIEATWTAVRATQLVLDNVDLSGARLRGCDLGRAMFLELDARRVVLHGSILEEALIRGGTWRGADLAGVSLRGATICGTPGRRVDLRGINLRGASLRDVQFDGADLRGADLREVDAAGCTLRNCLLKGALLDGSIWTSPLDPSSDSEDNMAARSEIARQLVAAPVAPPDRSDASLCRDALTPPDSGPWAAPLRADLRATQLANRSLPYSRLIQADLRAADLHGAHLASSDLTDANLAHARLDEADLSFARLTGASLRGALLSDAKFSSANLNGADLSESACQGAKFSHAQLVGATFCFATLAGADFADADCRDADFRMAQIDETKLTNADSLAGAWLPNGSRVELLDGIIAQGDMARVRSLRFVHCDATCERLEFSNKQELYGARFTRTSRDSTFDGVNLQYAQLRGQFLGCSFRGADLRHARLSGRFLRCDFQGANFTDAILEGAQFRDVTFQDALITPVQLQQAQSISGCVTSSDESCTDYYSSSNEATT